MGRLIPCLARATMWRPHGRNEPLRRAVHGDSGVNGGCGARCDGGVTDRGCDGPRPGTGVQEGGWLSEWVPGGAADFVLDTSHRVALPCLGRTESTSAAEFETAGIEAAAPTVAAGPKVTAGSRHGAAVVRGPENQREPHDTNEMRESRTTRYK